MAPAPIMAPIGGSPAYSQSEPYNPSVQTGERPPTAHNEQLGYAPPPPPASQKKVQCVCSSDFSFLPLIG